MAFKPLTPRARWTTVALAATAVADAVAVVVDWFRYDLLGRIDSGGQYTLSEVNASDHRQAVVGAIQTVLFVVTVIAFLAWFRRAYDNVDALGGARRYKRGWAIGAWFVPILNLWRPKQIANDLWRTSDPEGWNEQAASHTAVSPLLTLWWVLFLLSSWTSQVAGRIARSGDTAHALQNAAATYLVGDAIDILAAALAIAVVLKLTERQEERARRRVVAPALG